MSFGSRLILRRRWNKGSARRLLPRPHANFIHRKFFAAEIALFEKLFPVNRYAVQSRARVNHSGSGRISNAQIVGGPSAQNDELDREGVQK